MHTDTHHDAKNDSVLCEVWHTDYRILQVDVAGDDGNHVRHDVTPTLSVIQLVDLFKPIYVLEEFPGIHEGTEDELVDCMS